MGKTPAGATREKVLRFVRERLLAGRPPTVREVQAAFRFRSVRTAREHLERLVAEGRLAKEPGRARGLRLPGRERVFAAVPLLGRVRAGLPTTAVEDLEGYLPAYARGGELFALRVRGESMRDAGILEGDVVIVRKQATARPGEIVVALLGDEATVKRFALRGGRIELRAAHAAFPPIHPDPREFRLLGKVVEVRRFLEGAP
jgi:repressor LexA